MFRLLQQRGGRPLVQRDARGTEGELRFLTRSGLSGCGGSSNARPFSPRCAPGAQDQVPAASSREDPSSQTGPRFSDTSREGPS